LANSEITLTEAKSLTKRLSNNLGEDPETFARGIFERILARHPTAEELKLCREFLTTRSQNSSSEHAQEALVMVLFNHNDFVSIR
jgi:hypothetical protein